MTSTKEASFRYRYDEIESLPFWVDADANINDCIDPDPTGASFAVDYQHDLIYEKLHTLDAELGQLYQSLGKVGSELSKYDAGFFWLRLPEPNNGTSFPYNEIHLFELRGLTSEQKRRRAFAKTSSVLVLIGCHTK